MMGKNMKYLIAGVVVSLGVLTYIGYKHRDMFLLGDTGEDDEGCEGGCNHCGGSCSSCDDVYCRVSEGHVCGDRISGVTACHTENPGECAADAVTKA